MELALTIEKVFDVIGMIVVIVAYGSSSYYNIGFLRKAIWTNYSWIKIALTLCELIFCILFLYLLIMRIIGDPIPTSIFGFFAIRPAIAALGISLLFASRARYNTLMHGGEKWILKTSHK